MNGRTQNNVGLLSLFNRIHATKIFALILFQMGFHQIEFAF